MPRPRAPKAQEEPSLPAEGTAEAEEGEDNAPERAESPPVPTAPPVEYLKVVIILRDGRGSIGLQRFGCDPFLATTPDAELANALARVPELLAAADDIWRERRQHPRYIRPAPAPRPTAPPRGTRTATAPAAPPTPQQSNLF